MPRTQLINEQIKLLQNKQLNIQHITQNQIKVLNATVAFCGIFNGHIENLEKTLVYNENLLLNVTNRMQ